MVKLPMLLRRWKRMLLLAVIGALLPSSVLAAPAYSGVVCVVEQATGQAVEIRNIGDEFFSYMIDTANNVLVVDQDGFFRYVVQENDAYALGGYVTQTTYAVPADATPVTRGASGLCDKLTVLLSDIGSHTPQLFSFDGSTYLPPDYDYVGDAAQGREHALSREEYEDIENAAMQQKPEGSLPLLVLKVGFEDIGCAFDDTAWHQRIFCDGVSSYFTTVSNGKFTYTPAQETSGVANDGVVTVMLPFPAPVYTLASVGQNKGNDVHVGLYSGSNGKKYAIHNASSVFAYAMLAAEGSIDVAAYDRNQDGCISPKELAILVVYSGMEVSWLGRQACAGLPAIWAHSSRYNDGACYKTMDVDGVQVYKYTMIGEHSDFELSYDYYTRQGTPKQSQIGTICHELGHDLGLKDLYDTQSQGLSANVGEFSLMATGCNGYNIYDPNAICGSSPTHLDPFSKIYLGFYSSETVSGDGQYRLYATEPANTYNILRINTNHPDVYYLLENRQIVGFDVGLTLSDYAITNGGVVIWRINEKAIREYWSGNSINNHEGNYGIMPLFYNIYNNPHYPTVFWNGRFMDGIPTILQENPLISALFESYQDTAMSLDVMLHFDAAEAPVSVPQTGDAATPLIWLLLALAALSGIGILLWTNHRSTKNHRQQVG